MASVTFFEVPGSTASRRLEQALRSAGHEVTPIDLRTHDWSAGELYAFLREYPVPEWFDPDAPKVRSGEVTPDRIDAGSALRLLLSDVSLVRGPLLQVGPRRAPGFDERHVRRWLGLEQGTDPT